MWQNIIVVVVLVVCAIYIGRRFYRQLSNKRPSCGGSCNGCGGVQPEAKQNREAPGNGAGKPDCCP